MRSSLAAFSLIGLLAGCGKKEASEDQKVRLAFASYDAALKAGNLEALKAQVAGEKAEELSKPEAAQLLQLAARMRPADAAITSCRVTGDRASLELKGSLDGKTATASVTMQREKGAWRLTQEAWTLKIDLTGGAAAPEPDAAPPPMESMSPALRKRVDAVASADAGAGAAAWNELGTPYSSASAFLKDLRPALWDERPVAFQVIEESFKGGGQSFRYFSAKASAGGAAVQRAKTVGESLSYHLWRLEDASNSGFKGAFPEWWAKYSKTRGLPAFR